MVSHAPSISKTESSGVKKRIDLLLDLHQLNRFSFGMRCRLRQMVQFIGYNCDHCFHVKFRARQRWVHLFRPKYMTILFPLFFFFLIWLVLIQNENRFCLKLTCEAETNILEEISEILGTKKCEICYFKRNDTCTSVPLK